METEANKDIVRAYVEAFNRFDMVALCDLFTADARIYGVLGRRLINSDTRSLPRRV